jgi:hypothetical protein
MYRNVIKVKYNLSTNVNIIQLIAEDVSLKVYQVQNISKGNFVKYNIRITLFIVVNLEGSVLLD